MEHSFLPQCDPPEVFIWEEKMLFVCYLFLLFLLLYGARVAPAGQFFGDALSYESDLPLRGFFMLLIVFHHLSQLLTDPGSLEALQGIGILCVSFFFFQSGYGLMKNTLRKTGYLCGFLHRRFCKLLLPFFLCNLIFVCVNISLGTVYSPVRLFKCLTGLELVNTHAWFILTSALFQAVFFFIFRFVRGQGTRYFLLLSFQIAYACFCMRKGSGLQLFEGPWWFNSSGLFFIGVLFAGYEAPAVAFFRKNYRLLAGLCPPVFLLFYNVSVFAIHAFPYPSGEISALSAGMLKSWFDLGWQTLAVTSFCLAVTLFTLKVKCSNRILLFLGKISPELYLIHGLFIQLFHGQLILLENEMLFILSVLVCSIAAAAVLHIPCGAAVRFLQTAAVPARFALPPGTKKG